MIEETEVLEAVLAEHAESAAFKFVQETWSIHHQILRPAIHRKSNNFSDIWLVS